MSTTVHKKNGWQRFGEKWWWSIIGLLLILGGGFWLRWDKVELPSGYLFDEHYHIPTAKLMARGDARAFEFWHGELLADGEVDGSWIDWLHPPLHKYWQAINMKIWGETNPLAWRLSAVISGTLLIGLVYWLAAKSFKRPGVALIAAAVVAFDPQLIIQSRIGMNDMMVTMMMVVVVILWFGWAKAKPENSWWWWIIVAIGAGLAVATKWSAALILPFILLLSLARPLFKNWQEKLVYVLTFCLVTGFVYLLSYLPFFMSGKNLADFYELNNQIFRYQLLNDLSHPVSSRPWEWIVGQKEIILTTRPEQYGQPITLQANRWLMTLNLMVLSFTLVVLVTQMIAKKNQLIDWIKMADCQYLGLFFGLYLWAFLPWIFSPRPMFLYHYFPALPYLAILVGFWLDFVIFGRWREKAMTVK